MKQLTYAEIVDATGVINVEELENIEILFTTCDSIASMERCARLKRLSMIDNGLKVISGLEPVRMTLMSLCLCDQEIVSIGKLDLPCLRELFLHRNRISDMTGLSKCPRLTKLWLFQNNVKAIADLNCLTELEECWLQANRIKKLDGLEYNSNLIYLGIAGNPITEHSEFLKLKCLNNLQELSLNDIHFGKCDVVLDGAAAGHGGYKDFIMCHLPQVHLLDGISLSKAHQRQAQVNYDQEVRHFNAQLQEIEESYRREIQAIDRKREGSATHSKSLESDIAASLRGLEDIVRGGRKAVDGEIVRQKALLDENFSAFDTNITQIYEKTAAVVEQGVIPELNQEYDLIEALFHLTESVAVADARMVECCVEAYEQHQHQGQGQEVGSVSPSVFAFSVLGENTLDFQYMSNVLNASRYANSTTTAATVVGAVSAIGAGGMSMSVIEDENAGSSSSAASAGASASAGSGSYCLGSSLVLMKLYRLCFVPAAAATATMASLTSGSSTSSSATVRVYAVMTPAMLSVILRPGGGGWERAAVPATATNNNAATAPSSGSSMLWCTDPEVAVAMFLNTPYTKSFCTDDRGAGAGGPDGGEGSPGRKSPRQRQQSGPEDTVFPVWSVLEEARKTKIVMLLCCQLDLAKAHVSPSGNTTAVTVLPHDPSKRVALLNDLKNSVGGKAGAVSLEVVMEHGAASVSGSVPGPPATLFVVPCAVCNAAIQVEFAAVCATPMATMLLFGHSNASLAGDSLMLDASQHGVKPLEHKLELMLLACGHPNKGDHKKAPSIPELLVQFENEVNYECLKYQEDLLEDLPSVQGDKLRNVDYQLYAKENDTRKVRGEIERERKTQDMLLRDLRQQLQQQQNEETPANTGRAGGGGGGGGNLRGSQQQSQQSAVRSSRNR